MGNEISKKVTPLTQYNGPNEGLIASILGFSDETVEKGYPDRTNFYFHWLASHDSKTPDVFHKIMEIVGLARTRNEKIDTNLVELENLINEYKNTNSNAENATDLEAKIKDSIKKSGYKDLLPQQPQAGGGDIQKYLFNGIKNGEDGKSIVDDFNSLEDPAKKKIVADRLYRHPIYSPNNNKVQLVDRAIFIALTYIVRSIALFVTEWAIFSGYISRFSGAFNMYFAMYICIFLLLVFITNAQEDDLVFKILLFYINSSAEDGKGLTRIIVHIFCILLVLPVPYIVKDYNIADRKPSNLSFSERAAILSSVDKFTLYVWILTTIIGFNL